MFEEGKDILDLQRIFNYHSVDEEQIAKFQSLRKCAFELSLMIASLCPEGSEKSCAIEKLREVVMWANSAIACEVKEE